jgi:signal transduction histidine kinase
VNLNTLTEECVARARTLHHRTADSLQYAGAVQANIMGDADEVSAAVSNLIDNAVKYSGSTVKVMVEADEKEGRFVSVRVKDEGMGIAKSELTQIFKRFYRVPGPLAARIKGTGLGLFIVRSVARQHGGRAWAESEGPGRGSTFILQFPVAR